MTKLYNNLTVRDRDRKKNKRHYFFKHKALKKYKIRISNKYKKFKHYISLKVH